ncbi:MAG: hypothetical protein OEV63_10890 [Gammaproteobacteria bacterium]|nr:hypothetical protein [Gammaproteobacteria bacterium]MDH5213881.1 hypothetical protein [Gammaproteobacteria bacterium]MDH5500831.1 hypothetical protein [Gammaproteobacteria bacterium]
MDESEQALRDAAESDTARHARIAQQTLEDPKTHRIWEGVHAELVRPVAANRKRVPQVLALRAIDIRLVHKQALIDHIRMQQLTGRDRKRMFAIFYGPKDLRDAILTEHRQYTLAVSSYLSTDHLIRVMYDPEGARLLKQYEESYMKYFELYGYAVRATEQAWAEALTPLMSETRIKVKQLRDRIVSEAPDDRYADFDQQALLARSGRYPALNYMNR